MHQVVPLGLPFARVGNLYWEDGGRRVLYVFPKLCPELEGADLAALRAKLAQRTGADKDFDEVVIIPKDGPAPHSHLTM